MQIIKIKEDFIRLDSALKLSGLVGTGGQAKILIQDCQVKVNDEICVMRGKKLRKGDVFEFDGEKVRITRVEPVTPDK